MHQFVIENYIVLFYFPRVTQYFGSLYNIIQFSDVARPIMPQKTIERESGIQANAGALPSLPLVSCKSRSSRSWIAHSLPDSRSFR